MHYELTPYEPPSWTRGSGLTAPTHRVLLAQLPTPLHPWKPPPPPPPPAPPPPPPEPRSFDEGNGGGSTAAAAAAPTAPWCLRDVATFIKRDDATGSDVSGNKVRKLEFLLAECRRGDYDSVITVGGVQSNHVRATACAARQLGYQPHVILRGADDDPSLDPRNPESLTGNLLYDRLVGAVVHRTTADALQAVGGCVCFDEEAPTSVPYALSAGGWCRDSLPVGVVVVGRRVVWCLKVVNVTQHQQRQQHQHQHQHRHHHLLASAFVPV
jgi:hypothetical protein